VPYIFRIYLMTSEEYIEQCYLLGRYLEYYKEDGSFENVSASLINEGLSFRNTGIKIPSSGNTEFDAIDFLMHMIARDNIYDAEDQKRCPILLYTSDPICYGVLNSFIYEIASELDNRGYLTEIFDLPTDGVKHPERLLNRRFKAVIGVHTEFFSSKIKDNIYFHDMIYGPKFIILLDHPGTFYKVLTDCPEDFYVITLDENYKKYVDKYFPKVKGTFVIPPGGKEYANIKIEKDIPLSFVGSYHDFRLWLPALQEFDKENDGLGTEFINIAEDHINLPWEEDLKLTINNRLESGKMLSSSESEFARLFYDLVLPRSIVLSKTREKIILEILKSGLTLHVYGDSWKSPIFDSFDNLIVHDEVSPEDSLEIFARSKISLNIMSWHKAGMTERLSNIMLNKSVVVSDESTYLNEHYKNDEDIISFNLTEKEIKALPDRIKALLADENKLYAMAENAFKKASKLETWQHRTDEIIKIIMKVSGTS